MTSSQVPVDWDGLEMATAMNPGEWACCFDLRNGEVRTVPADHLGVDGDWPSEEEINAGLQAGHLIYVDRLDSSVEDEWMAEFAGTVGDARLRNRQEAILGGRGPFRRFKDVLLDHAAERQRWFAFRTGRCAQRPGSGWWRTASIQGRNRRTGCHDARPLVSGTGF